MNTVRITGVAGLLVVLTACGPQDPGSAAGSSTTPATSAGSAPAAAAPDTGSSTSGSSSDDSSGGVAASAAPAASGPASQFDDGQYASPDDVVPGNYRSAGPSESGNPLCYADTTPTAGGNIDQQEVSNGGPVRIRVKRGQTVKAQGCQTFKRVGA